MLIFAARMRVAYRRDYIKLRNRSFYTKPLVEHLRLLFLIWWCTRIEHFDSRHVTESLARCAAESLAQCAVARCAAGGLDKYKSLSPRVRNELTKYEWIKWGKFITENLVRCVARCATGEANTVYGAFSDTCCKRTKKFGKKCSLSEKMRKCLENKRNMLIFAASEWNFWLSR